MCMGCVCVYVCVGVYVLCVRHKNSTSLKPLIIAGQKIERERLCWEHTLLAAALVMSTQVSAALCQKTPTVLLQLDKRTSG